MDTKNEQLTLHVSHDLFKPSAFKALDGFYNIKNVSGKSDTFTFDEPVKYNITITNTGDAFLISGTAEGSATTSCSRCLEDVHVDMKANIDAYYLIDPPETEEENEINEFEILPDDHIIPLGEIIKSTLVVDAPAKPLCKEDCKGLCPKCGTNLNNGSCECKDEPDPSNPFSVLKDYKV